MMFNGVYSVKGYPFNVYSLCEFEGCMTVGYYTKGHHDKQRFVDEIRAQYGEEVNIDWVRHSYGKCIPVTGIKGSSCLHEFKKPVRGSFPMTYVDV